MIPKLWGRYARWLMVLILGAVICPASTFAVESDGLVLIQGNRVLIDEVYFAILDLPADARADAATARLVRSRLLRFLRDAGYKLAVVKVAVSGHNLVVEVDEGRLEKIVFIGRGPLTTLQLKLALNLPHHVFNMSTLERQLKEMEKKFGLVDVTYQLVLADRPDKHVGPQIDHLGNIMGADLLVAEARYELYIELGGQERSPGWGLGFDYDFPDGLATSVAYRGFGWLVSDDRVSVRAKAGGILRRDLLTDDPYPALSRVVVETNWYMPALLGKWFRPHVWASSDLVSRQRKDLDVEIYYGERAGAGAALGFEFGPAVRLSLGSGLQERVVFGTELLAATASPARDFSQTRAFVIGNLDVLFQSDELRSDRTDKLQLSWRRYGLDSEPRMDRISTFYRKLFRFGYHDLWLRFAGVYMGGNVQFDDDESVGGTYLRGVFGSRYYARRAAGISTEFRMSITRDLLKVSAFHDLAVFGDQDRMAQTEVNRIADSFGCGFHALLLDAFQFSIYYAVGFSSDGSFDQGSAVSLEKVF
jgi:hypothetical protein